MLLLLLACSDGPPRHIVKDEGTGDSAGSPEAFTEYYTATSRIRIISGPTFDEEYIVRRIHDPAASTIEEEFITTADAVETRALLEVNVPASTFELSFDDDSYTGSGTLDGPDWAWTSWTSHAVAPDQSWVDSVDARTEDDGIHTEKDGYSNTGTLEWTLVEDLVPISQAEWEEAHAKL